MKLAGTRLGSAGILLCLLSSPGLAETLVSKPADSFVAAIGVNTHIWDEATVYARRFDLVKQRLVELGVRHVRDSASGNYSGYLGRVEELGRLGITFNLIVDPRPPTSGIGKGLKFVEAAGPAVRSVEGPNEYDRSGARNWPEALRRFQAGLFAAARQSRHPDLIVVAPSLTTRDAFGLVGDLASMADRSNVHHYFSGRHPGTKGWGAGGYGSVPWGLANAERQVAGRPVFVTETGYPNALKSTSDHLPVSERIAGRYIPRLILEFLNRGVARIYLYELVNSSGDEQTDLEASFGLVRNDASLSPKPAFVALKNLISLISDRDIGESGDGRQRQAAGAAGDGEVRRTGAITGAHPLALDVVIRGDTADVRKALFRKANGAFYLALWIELPAWEPNARRETDVKPRRISVETPGVEFTKSTLHALGDDGSLSSEPAFMDAIEVTDRVSFLELRP